MKKQYPFIPYRPKTYSSDEMMKRSQEFYQWANSRRSVREFSNKPVPREIIENIIRSAGTAPSGANRQPWTFIVVSDDDIKHKIREAVEAEEKTFYESRISEEQRQALTPLGTSWEKPYLEAAPYLIVVFRQDYSFDENNNKRKHYYVRDSVGISIGILIMAIHKVGLVTLTHTPSPMNFLRDILERPPYEKPVVLMPVGYPPKGVAVPDIQRKNLQEIMIWK
jgi:nitroreductase